MRMAFDSDDESAYFERREELCTQFNEWARRLDVDADAGDVELLLDWKWGYADGRLDHWDAADVEEFLLRWCPRKVASPPELIESIPRSVTAYVDFLAHEGLLAPGCSPAAVQRACKRLGPRFRREMADPANFGMAKSLFGGGLDDPEATAVLDQIARLTGTSPDAVLDLLDDAGPDVVGPVRAPTDQEVAASIAEARMFAQVRGLAARCAPPGLALTAKGNLRLADARRLVVELQHRRRARHPAPQARVRVRAALSELAGPHGDRGRRGASQRGRLVGVARFAERSERDAYERTVRGALEAGLGSPTSWAWGAAEPDDDDGSAIVILAELLDAGDPGASVDDLVAVVGPLLGGYGPLAGLLAWRRS